MHNNIYKYELNIVERQDLFLPEGAKIISAQNQRDKVCIWAMVDVAAKPESRAIAIGGTGALLPRINPDQSLIHIDTVQLRGMVWHVFEIKTNNI